MSPVSTVPGLQPIPSYEMPSGTWDDVDCPVAWRADPNRMVLLIHDMQRYFIRPFVADHDALATAIANMRRLRVACTRAGIPVLFTVQPGGQSPHRRGLLCDFWGPGMATGGDEEVIDELRPGERDEVLPKHRYSAFVDSGLQETLLRAGRDQLAVCGVYAHIGCLVTCCDAFMRDLQAFLVADAVADFSLARHRSAVDWVAEQCARVVSSSTLLAELGERE